MGKSILRFLVTILLFAIIGAVIMGIFINSTDAECDLQSDRTYTCQISKQLLGRYPVSARVIEGVVDVTVEDDGCVDGCAYRVEFVLNNGKQEPFNNVYTDKGPVNRQAEFFRSQIKSREESISYHIDPPWWVLFLAGGMTLLFVTRAFRRMMKESREAENSLDSM